MTIPNNSSVLNLALSMGKDYKSYNGIHFTMVGYPKSVTDELGRLNQYLILEQALINKPILIGDKCKIASKIFVLKSIYPLTNTDLFETNWEQTNN